MLQPNTADIAYMQVKWELIAYALKNINWSTKQYCQLERSL